MPDPASLLPELEALLIKAGRLAQDARLRLDRQLKPDGSVVTNADKSVETFFREKLPKLVPGSAVWGEEFGYAKDEGAGLWVVDPVDGTTNFAFGSPLWGVTVAYLKGDEILAGGISLPDLNEVFLASKGGGAFRNGEKLASICPGPIQPHEPVSCSQYVFNAVPGIPFPGKWRCAGAFVIDGSYVACQRFRALIGFREKLYDIGGSLILNSELGAEIRFADGSPLTVASLLEDREIGRPWVIVPKDCGFILSV